MGFQRARSEDQILQRRQEIISAAASIYNKSGYEGLSFSSVSKHTSFTRQSIYKYFSSKDEILLDIFLDDLKQWVDQLTGTFKLNKIYSLEEIADIWTEAYANNERLLKLYSILFTTLQKNASIEALKDFKNQSVECMLPLLNFVNQLFAEASEEKVQHFLSKQFSLVLGLYSMCNPEPNLKEAKEHLDTKYNMPDFINLYKSSIYQLMYCLKNNIDIH